MSEWLPIETAPKNGEWTLVRLGNGEVFRAMWLNRVGWHVASDIGAVNPQHWMPLPPPPTGKAER